jgi:hypothetical protein
MVDKAVLAASTAQKLSMGQQLLSMSGQSDDASQAAIVAAALQLLKLAIESYVHELLVQEATNNNTVTKLPITIPQLGSLSTDGWVTPELREIIEIASADCSWLDRLTTANSHLATKPMALRPMSLADNSASHNGVSQKEGLLNFVELSADGGAQEQSSGAEVSISLTEVRGYFSDFERMLLRHRADMQEC